MIIVFPSFHKNETKKAEPNGPAYPACFLTLKDLSKQEKRWAWQKPLPAALPLPALTRRLGLGLSHAFDEQRSRYDPTQKKPGP
ncbi:MAG TPA: hypothetical protein H9988_05760 [Candidatus Acutalibacter stercoravium]|nr:hypothetical protein [Candidatus Acutalibacter stercoravium]